MSEKRKIIVVGLGREFIELKSNIFKMYDVLYLSDNYYSDEITTYEGVKFVPIRMINKTLKHERILICTKRYYWQLRRTLQEDYSISENLFFDYFMTDEIRLQKEREKLQLLMSLGFRRNSKHF